MNELFDIPPCDSPRLAWVKRNKVKTKFCSGIDVEDESSPSLYPWTAFSQSDDQDIATGGGETEMDAIHALALLKGWLLWNEE